MKSRSITTIILEGTDGVGKSAIIDGLCKHYKFRYMVYHRGDMSNIVYAEKFKRYPALTQIGLPFLHVLLTCNKSSLEQRIRDRAEKCHLSKASLDGDLLGIDDQYKFIDACHQMMRDYHCIIVDTSYLTVTQSIQRVISEIDNYIQALDKDETVSAWNKHYDKGCQKLGLQFCSRGNQPYINNIPFMSESTLQNGVYEQFLNKDYPDNLIYSLGYNISQDEVMNIPKTFDFAYIINSKIYRRLEVVDYYQSFINSNKTCLVSNRLSTFITLTSKNLVQIDGAFGDDYIRTIAQAKATVYAARDLAYLKLQTCRLYESIMARQIVFVDSLSDPNDDMLRQIHNDTTLQALLTVGPSTICGQYDYIITNKDLYDRILTNQTNWYAKLRSTCTGGLFNA